MSDNDNKPDATAAGQPENQRMARYDALLNELRIVLATRRSTEAHAPIQDSRRVPAHV